MLKLLEHSGNNLTHVGFVQAEPASCVPEFVQHIYSMGAGTVAHWSDLSLELWINVLSRLRENLDPRLVWNQRDCLEIFAQEHSNMHRLRLVCSKFNTALDDAQLSRCLFLREGFSNKHLPNLLQWAERQRTCVQLFACNVRASVLEAALAAFACTGSQLHSVYFPRVSQAAVDILPCYSALHSIDLGSGDDKIPLLGLQPLAALPSLGKLLLSKGRFIGVESLLHLTNLQLSDAHVICSAACVWACKLLKLRLHDSRLYLPGHGLVACQNLRELSLRNCSVHATQTQNTLSLMYDAAVLVPAGMSALKQLTSLDVILCGYSLEDIDYSWLGSLTALQDLGFHAQEDVDLPAELTELTGMTSLWLTTADSDDGTACMEFQVNWRDMRALKILYVGSGLYAFDSQLLQLLDCATLMELYFDKVRPYSADSAKFFAALTHNLAVRRPDVACYLDQVRVSDVLELSF